MPEPQPCYTIRDRLDVDLPWIRALLDSRWGGSLVMVHGEAIDVLELPGLVAGHQAGLATYRVSGAEAELVTLDAVEAGCRVGTQLVDALVERLRRCGVGRLRVTTTNDNISALAFYQKRGFRLERVHVDAMDQTRRLKAGIPLVGSHGIPIRDEIDFYRDLFS